jgi:hypothetical protein
MNERPRPDAATGAAGERQTTFDRNGVALVAETFGIMPERLPLSVPGREVYQLILPDRQGRTRTLVTLWPWIGRVDVVAGVTTVIVTGVVMIRAAASGDVTFCRRSGETVVLGRDGRLVARL